MDCDDLEYDEEANKDWMNCMRNIVAKDKTVGWGSNMMDFGKGPHLICYRDTWFSKYAGIFRRL